MKPQQSEAELAAKAELTDIDHGLAQDSLNAIVVEENTTATGGAIPMMTPKDEQTARIQERQKYLDLLTANLDVIKTHIGLLRQMDKLDYWIHSCCSASGADGASDANHR